MKRETQKAQDCTYEIQEADGGVKQLVIMLPGEWFQSLRRAA